MCNVVDMLSMDWHVLHVDYKDFISLLYEINYDTWILIDEGNGLMNVVSNGLHFAKIIFSTNDVFASISSNKSLELLWKLY